MNTQNQDKTSWWLNKPLEEMNKEEWEALCDGCGICCLEKIQYEDTGEVDYTYVACRYLDISTCRCRNYENRFNSSVNCAVMTPENIKQLTWLPATCAYRIVAEGRELECWHPLVSGDIESVHEAWISIRDKVLPGKYIHPDDLEGYIM